MARWGRFVHRHRGSVVGASLLLLVLGIALVARGGSLKNTNTFDFEASRGLSKISAALPQAPLTFQLVIGSADLTVDQPPFRSAVDAAVAPLHHDPRVGDISVPEPAIATGSSNAQISADRHWMIVNVTVYDDFFVVSDYLPELLRSVHAEPLTVYPAGALALNSDFTTLSQSDIALAEKISLPVALVLLLIVFASIPAALLCLLVGGVAVVGGIGATFALSRVTSVSIYALNIVTLIGLGVAIDYSLFIVNRFREELRRGSSVEDALAVAMATAGRAIIYSGVTVALGLCGLLFYRGTFLGSLGYCGALVVGIAVFEAMTLLPAMLSILGGRIDRLALPFVHGGATRSGHGFWHGLALRVMLHPWVVLLPCIAVLVLAGSPFPQMRLANANVALLPPTAASHRGADLIAEHFPQAGANTLSVVTDFGNAAPLDRASIHVAFQMAQVVTHTPGVIAAKGYVALEPSAGEAYYQKLFASGLRGTGPEIAASIAPSLGAHIAVITATIAAPVSSDAARNVVRSIRAHDHLAGVTVDVTGATAFDLDFVDFMVARSVPAVFFVMVATFLILLILLRSVVLPLKAVAMNLLSLFAAFGAMVFIFQQGHFASVLNFTPASIDPTLPILLFCIVYGLSMDYEVFLLTRMQEAWAEHGDNRRAVAEGLEASGRLVTGAAAIMIGVFAAFAFASVVVVKSIGLGMAIAVFVDATIVRALVVPALMRLLGGANWWAPRWMHRRVPDRDSPLSGPVAP